MKFDQAPARKTQEIKHAPDALMDTMMSIIDIRKDLTALMQDAQAKYDGETAGKIQAIIDKTIETERMVNEDVGGWIDDKMAKAA